MFIKKFLEPEILTTNIPNAKNSHKKISGAENSTEISYLQKKF